MKQLILVILRACALAAAAFAAAAATLVPPGNRSAEQPDVPGASTKRTKAGKHHLRGQIPQGLRAAEERRELRGKIKRGGRRLRHRPDAHRRRHRRRAHLQCRRLRPAADLLRQGGGLSRQPAVSFAYDGEDIADFVQRPQFAECAGDRTATTSGPAASTSGTRSFRGKTVGGTSFPNDRFSAVFFQPFYAGQTFGLGQLNPLTALQMSDLVHQVSGLPRLDAGDPNAGLRDDHGSGPDAALCRGDAEEVDRRLPRDRRLRHLAKSRHHRDALQCRQSRSARLCAEGARTTSAAQPARRRELPEENYYGWLVNDKLPELQALF